MSDCTKAAAGMEDNTGRHGEDVVNIRDTMREGHGQVEGIQVGQMK